MAARTKAPVKPRSAAQIAAGRAWAAAGRAAQVGKPRTAKQIAASRANLVKARAAQSAQAAGKKYVSAAKTATAPLAVPRETPLLDSLPACAAAALAEHLWYWTGTAVTDEEVLALHELAGGHGAPIAEVLEAAAEHGLGGWRPDTWTGYAEPVPGLLCGLQLAAGYHAVLALPRGMLSWGMILPWPASPEEMWHLEWQPGQPALALSCPQQRAAGIPGSGLVMTGVCVNRVPWKALIVFLVILAVCGWAGWAIAAYEHGFAHFMGIDTQQSQNYDFVSGVGPMFITAIGLSSLIAGLWHHVNCHQSGCWRIGKHKIDGTPWCSYHHEAVRATDAVDLAAIARRLDQIIMLMNRRLP